MNRKLLPIVSAFLILAIVLGTTPLTYAVSYTIGPKLEVTTIPQDDQKREKGIIVLGLAPTANPGYNKHSTTGETITDLMSQHKIIVTYNGRALTWTPGTTGAVVPAVACNILEKDKVNVVRDPKTGKGKQGTYENVMTELVDVSSRFVCKVRWKSPAGAATLLESVGVLDVYWKGPATTETYVSPAAFIADHILVVTVYITLGRTVVWGTDMQDICVLGWAFPATLSEGAQRDPTRFTKPDGSAHFVFTQALGTWAGCEEAALYQRELLGLELDMGPDPLSTV